MCWLQFPPNQIRSYATANFKLPVVTSTPELLIKVSAINSYLLQQNKLQVKNLVDSGDKHLFSIAFSGP